MKKSIIISIFLVSVLFISGCSNQTTLSTIIPTVTLETYRCDMVNGTGDENCRNSDWDPAGVVKEYPINSTIDILKNITSIRDLSGDQIKDILMVDKSLNIASKDSISLSKGTKTIKITQKINDTCSDNNKTYDISLDLTYNNPTTKDKSAVEIYLKKYRIDRLRAYFEGTENIGIKLKEGDTIILRFIGTLDYQGSDTALIDSQILYFGIPCQEQEVAYEMINDSLEYNNSIEKLSFFYGLKKISEEAGFTKANVYNTVADLIARIESDFDKKYGINSEGTFLLNHIINNSLVSTYQDNYITLIFSDFLFQITPTDKKYFINKYCNIKKSFCIEQLYDFSRTNLESQYKNGYFFKSFYTEEIFKYLPELNNLCPKGDNNKMLPLFLVGINTVNDISIQDKMKDFYSKHLFKNCSVQYK